MTPPARIAGRRSSRMLIALLLVVLALALPAGAAAHTIVSVSFDDGSDSAPLAGKIFANAGLPATFFINTGLVGTSQRVTWKDVSRLARAGHEIGGHTLTHVDIATADYNTAYHQVCDDRQNLIKHGYAAKSFAYPYGDVNNGDPSNTQAETIVRTCGYSSARLYGGGVTPVYSEPFSVPDPFQLWSFGNDGNPVTLSYMQNNVEQGLGGWVIVGLHGVCDTGSCDGASDWGHVSPSDLTAFVSWLKQQPDLVVRTIGAVATDITPPVTTISCNGSSCSSSYTQPVQVSLKATDSGSMVDYTTYTTDGSAPTSSSTVYTGPFTVSSTTTIEYRSWDVRGNLEAAHTLALHLP